MTELINNDETDRSNSLCDISYYLQAGASRPLSTFHSFWDFSQNGYKFVLINITEKRDMSQGVREYGVHLDLRGRK